MLVIIDYEAGNLTSIKNMLLRLEVPATISGDPDIVARASRLILPGVGAFDHGMRNLGKRGLIEVLNRKVFGEGTPILGICLGVQLMTQRSDEGELPGLKWFDAETVAFDRSRLDERLRIPHMGWAGIVPARKSRLFEDMFEDPRFYFVHSFHLQCRKPEDVLATAEHGYPFTAGIERDNIIGVQFHPEKSHKFGKRLLRNFVDHY